MSNCQLSVHVQFITIIVGSSGKAEDIYTYSGSFLSLLDFFGEPVETDKTEKKKKWTFL